MRPTRDQESVGGGVTSPSATREAIVKGYAGKAGFTQSQVNK